MASEDLSFHNYESKYLVDCLALFDDNCPEYFAVNERGDYFDFLVNQSVNYQVIKSSGNVVAAFGLTVESEVKKAKINWIMASLKSQGTGIGKLMMKQILNTAQENSVLEIDIAASHLSSSFFAKFGANEVNYIKDGWGKNMHRVDMKLPLY